MSVDCTVRHKLCVFRQKMRFALPFLKGRHVNTNTVANTYNRYLLKFREMISLLAKHTKLRKLHEIRVLPILADNPQHNCSETDSRPLDEQLAFIEGDEEGEGGGVTSVSMTTNHTSKPGKKKKKTKKIHERKMSLPVAS